MSSRFILIAVMLALLANFPLLSAANVDGRPGGFPVLFVYIGSVWILGILMLFLTARRQNERPDE